MKMKKLTELRKLIIITMILLTIPNVSHAATFSEITEGSRLEIPIPEGHSGISYLGVIVSRRQPTTPNSDTESDYTQKVNIDGATSTFIPFVTTPNSNGSMILEFDNELTRRILFSTHADNPADIGGTFNPGVDHNLIEDNNKFKLEVDHIFRMPNGKDVVINGMTDGKYDILPLVIYYNVKTNEIPTMSIASPVNGTLRSGIVGFNTLQIQGLVNDLDIGDILTVKYKIDTGVETQLKVLTSTGIDQPIDETVNVDALSEGNHTITIWTEDDKGGKSTENVKSFVVIKTPPTITYVPNGNLTYEKLQTTQVIVTPKSPAIIQTAQYQWTTNNMPPVGGIWTNFAPGNNVGSPGGVTGIYYLHIRVTDNVGNIGISISNKFNIDNTIPTVPTITTNPIILGTDWVNINVITNVSHGTDLHSGIDRTEYMLTGATTSPWATYTIPLSVSNHGITTITVRSIDKAGNISNVTTKEIRIDKTLPTGIISGNTVNWVNPNVNLTVTASDTLSGVRRIQLPNLTWQLGSTATYQISVNGTYTFRIEDNAGNVRTITETVEYINVPVEILDFKVDNVMYEHGYYILDRTEIFPKFKANIEDLDITDELNYKIAITGPDTKTINGVIKDRTQANEEIKYGLNLAGWEDGIYTARLTVSDLKDGVPISSTSSEIKFIILRKKPPVPIISQVASVVTIEYPEHPIIKLPLSDLLLKKEYLINTPDFKEYTGPLPLNTIPSGSTVYAKYTDFNGNFSISIKEIYHTIPIVVDPDPDIYHNPDANIYIEELPTAIVTYINIRKENIYEIIINQFKYTE